MKTKHKLNPGNTFQLSTDMVGERSGYGNQAQDGFLYERLLSLVGTELEVESLDEEFGLYLISQHDLEFPFENVDKFLP